MTENLSKFLTEARARLDEEQFWADWLSGAEVDIRAKFNVEGKQNLGPLWTLRRALCCNLLLAEKTAR